MLLSKIKKHRFIFGPHLVGSSMMGNSVEIKKDFLAGTALIAGYKGTAKFGLIWQVYIGDVYLQDEFSDSKKYTHRSQLGFGLGYKF